MARVIAIRVRYPDRASSKVRLSRVFEIGPAGPPVLAGEKEGNCQAGHPAAKAGDVPETMAGQDVLDDPHRGPQDQDWKRQPPETAPTVRDGDDHHAAANPARARRAAEGAARISPGILAGDQCLKRGGQGAESNRPGVADRGASTAAIGEKPRPTRRGAVTATGTPNPPTPCRNDGKGPGDQQGLHASIGGEVGQGGSQGTNGACLVGDTVEQEGCPDDQEDVEGADRAP